MAYAAADGHPALRLHIDETNELTLAVYRSLGFVEVEKDGKRIEMRVGLDGDLVEAV
jgi:ribosomal protein S18 acetylase RimI-like enzyme